MFDLLKYGEKPKLCVKNYFTQGYYCGLKFLRFNIFTGKKGQNVGFSRTVAQFLHTDNFQSLFYKCQDAMVRYDIM